MSEVNIKKTTIKDICQKYDISASLVRKYEAKGILKLASKKHRGKRRFYTSEDQLTLAKILILRRIGLGIDEIKALKDKERKISNILRSCVKGSQEEREINKLNLSNEGKELVKHGHKINFTPYFYFCELNVVGVKCELSVKAKELLSREWNEYKIMRENIEKKKDKHISYWLTDRELDKKNKKGIDKISKELEV